MKLGFNFLILSILVVCFWFYNSNAKSKSYYRGALNWLMICAGVLYLNRIYGIGIEDYGIFHDDVTYTIEKTIHYFLATIIYPIYSTYLFFLLGQFKYAKKWKMMLYYLPCITLEVLILTSWFSKAIFYIDDGTFYYGPLFFLVYFFSFGYAIDATLYSFVKRKLMPKIFAQATIIIFASGIIQCIIFAIFRDSHLYNSTLIITIVVVVLTLIVVEFYKDRTTNLLNKEAFLSYISTEIGRNKQKTIYLIKLKNYQYLKENCYETSLHGTIKELAECIKEYSLLSTIFYLEEGKFALIVPMKSKFSEEEFLSKIKDRFCVPFNVNGASVQLSLFIAVMGLERGKITKDNFMKYFMACDEMKYRSNEEIEVVSGDSFGVDQVQRLHNVEEAINRALIEDEFRVFYQPIVCSKTNRIVSAEALLRLNDRVMGFISPEEFIPISEVNGKIIEISEFVIDNVFRFVKENNLEELGMDFVEMNLSMIQCMDKNLPGKLQYYIEKYQVDPAKINLEITETATNYDEEQLRLQLDRIKALGFSFSLDDYGTGYSNLVRMMEYPIDMIKIDKSIIWSAFHVSDNFITLKNLISMFHDVRRKIVAEGVESEEQKEALINLGCDYLQGYYFSKPICESDFLRFVNNYRN